MHAETANWVMKTCASWRCYKKRMHVLDLGGRDVNGNVRLALPDAKWWCVDIVAGPGVDEVADATTWRPKSGFDVAMCLEVFEHTSEWRAICKTLVHSVAMSGLVLITAACDPRPPHGANGEVGLPEGEYYENVKPADLEEELLKWFSWTQMSVLSRGDVRVLAIK